MIDFLDFPNYLLPGVVLGAGIWLAYLAARRDAGLLGTERYEGVIALQGERIRETRAQLADAEQRAAMWEGSAKKLDAELKQEREAHLATIAEYGAKVERLTAARRKNQ